MGKIGTEYILFSLIQKELSENIQLINLDLSGDQLVQIHSSKIKTVKGSFSEFKREGLANPNQQFMLIVRSLLHYVDWNRLMDLLAHICSQMCPGEIFLHQTAYFKNEHNANCLNSFYEQIGTDKWYPTVKNYNNVLKKCLSFRREILLLICIIILFFAERYKNGNEGQFTPLRCVTFLHVVYKK